MSRLKPKGLKELDRAGCAFCGRHRREVGELLQGPGCYICDSCVRSFLKDPQGLGRPTEFVGFRAEDPEDALLCWFCRGILRKREPDEHPEPEICLDCLEVCRQILVENEEFDRTEGGSTYAARKRRDRGGS